MTEAQRSRVLGDAFPGEPGARGQRQGGVTSLGAHVARRLAPHHAPLQAGGVVLEGLLRQHVAARPAEGPGPAEHAAAFLWQGRWQDRERSSAVPGAGAQPPGRAAMFDFVRRVSGAVQDYVWINPGWQADEERRGGGARELLGALARFGDGGGLRDATLPEELRFTVNRLCAGRLPQDRAGMGVPSPDSPLGRSMQQIGQLWSWSQWAAEQTASHISDVRALATTSLRDHTVPGPQTADHDVARWLVPRWVELQALRGWPPHLRRPADEDRAVGAARAVAVQRWGIVLETPPNPAQLGRLLTHGQSLPGVSTGEKPAEALDMPRWVRLAKITCEWHAHAGVGESVPPSVERSPSLAAAHSDVVLATALVLTQGLPAAGGTAQAQGHGQGHSPHAAAAPAASLDGPAGGRSAGR